MSFKLLYTIAQPVLRFFFRLFFFARCFGKSNVPLYDGLVVSANHRSNFDPVFVGAFLPRKMKYLAKEELFKNKLFDWFLRGLGAIPVARGSSEIGILKMFISLLKGGNAVSVFPEGTRRRINIEDVKPGAILFAIKAKVPVIPAAVIGNYKLFRPMKLVFGRPKYYTEYYDKKLTSDELHTLGVELMKEIYDMVGEHQSENSTC